MIYGCHEFRARLMMGGMSVTLGWSNQTTWKGYSVVYGTTDFAKWYSITQVPAKVGEVRVTLTNRPRREFYRAMNR